MKKLPFFSLIILLIFISCNSNQKGITSSNDSLNTPIITDKTNKAFLGSDIAKKILERFTKDTTSNLLRGEVLINDKLQLISIAEPILFNIYGRELILEERPYEIYLFGDYWIMLGTLKGDTMGGTFSFAINRKTCEVIGISHGK